MIASHFRNAAQGALLLLSLAAALPALAAGTPTVFANVSGSTAFGPGPVSESAFVPIDVTRNDGPLYAEASGQGGSSESIPIGPGLEARIFTSAAAAGFASAAPGVLRAYGADRAIAQPAILGPNLPPTLNNNWVYTQIQAQASFTDYLTVGVAGLAAGTAVQVPMQYVVEVVSDYPLGYPPFAAHPITVGASFTIPGYGPQNFSTESAFNYFQRTELPSGLGLYRIRSSVIMVNAVVGEELAIGAALGISGQANITDFNRLFQFGGFADARNTAGIWLGDLPEGMTVTSASGHDYRIDPTTIAAVPEPASYALLLVGLGVVMGWRARRAV